VTVNPRNGRSEHVFVNLEALYPSPEINGTELCFEELMAGHRGWLDKVWKPETSQARNDSPQSQDHTDESNVSIDNISREISEKLIKAHDPVMLDENGAAKEHGREGKGRRMKIKEVNETQISEYSRTKTLEAPDSK
jgi:checkpoint serine/threonine-protein kinase